MAPNNLHQTIPSNHTKKAVIYSKVFTYHLICSKESIHDADLAMLKSAFIHNKDTPVSSRELDHIFEGATQILCSNMVQYRKKSPCYSSQVTFHPTIELIRTKLGNTPPLPTHLLQKGFF